MNGRKFLVLYNPISGTGSAPALAESFAALARAEGVEIELNESEPEYDSEKMSAVLSDYNAVIVCGGDGTVRALLRSLALSQVPFCLLPAGNESLLARALKLGSDPAQVLRRVNEGKVTKRYFALAGEKPFLLMLSVGLDSKIISWVCRRRRGTVRFADYLAAIFACLPFYRAPQIRLSGNGKTLIDAERGSLIIANHSEYASFLDPVSEADGTRAELVAKFFPGLSLFGYLAWLPAYFLGRPYRTLNERVFIGSEFELEIVGLNEFPLQADGDLAGNRAVHVRLAEQCVLTL